MADAARKVIRLGGPWKGINERSSEATPQQCEDAWNLDFDGEYAETRGGREQIGTMASAAVGKVIWEDIPVEGAHVYKDRTEGLASGVSSANTEFDMAGWAADDYLYIGFPFKFASFYIYANTVNTVISAMSAAYYNGNGWQTLSVTDGTRKFIIAEADYASLGQSGSVTFTAPTDWSPVAIQGGDALYWVRLKWNYAPIVAHLGYINCSVIYNSTLLPINGIYHWQRNNGERVLIVGADDPVNNQARLFEYNRILGTAKPFVIRGVNGAVTSGSDAEWRFAVLGKRLIACNGYCFLHSTDEDPRVMVPFEKITVRDAADLKPFIPTDVRYAAVYAGRIYVVLRSQPNTVFFSQPVDGPVLNDIIGAAPMQGAGIFDREFSFYCADPSGGPITAIVPQKDKLLILTPRSTQAWIAGGDNILGSALQTLDNEVGCVAPGSVASTNSGVFFLGAGSVYVNVNGTNQDIGDRIFKTIGSLNTMSLAGARSAVYLKKNQYRLYVPAGTDNYNSVALVYNFKADTWTKYGLPRWLADSYVYSGKYFVSCAASLRDGEWEEELIEADYFGRLLWADTGKSDSVLVASTNTAVPIFWQLVTHRSKFAEGSILRVRSVRAFVESVGNTYFNVGLIRDGRKIDSRNSTTHEINVGEKIHPVYLYDDPSELDNTLNMVPTGFTTGFILGTDLWTARRIRPCDATFGDECFYFQLSLNALNSSGSVYEYIKISAVEIESVIQPGRR